jgi:hypothetical protein
VKARIAGLACIAAFEVALAADAVSITPFSAGAQGVPPKPWRELALPRIKPAHFSVVSDEAAMVLRVRSEQAAGTIAHSLDAEANATPLLSWRWKVDRIVERADMTQKAGDDFAARVYVFFDLPMEELTFAQRMRMLVARALHGRDVPTAALCYVWDNRHPVGTGMANPYTDRVRMIVVESGPGNVSKWVPVRRDLEADYRQAFPAAPDKPVPRITGIAAGADTDQTGESVTAWFTDFRLEPRR